MNNRAVEVDMTRILRARLLQIARQQDELAATEAAATPYWESPPASVHGHRTAAAALRAEADVLLAAV